MPSDANGPTPSPSRKSPRRGRWRRLWPIGLLLLLLIPSLLRLFVVEAFKIPAGSMIPTLLVGDHIFVTKLPYQAQRGDVIVFIYPRDESKDFIKRIIAVGGDTIAVRDNVPLLNGQAIKRSRVAEKCTYEDSDDTGALATYSCQSYEEELGTTRYRVIQTEAGTMPDYEPRQIPPGHVFVMGDNRDNSHDSRFWGLVPVGNIKGKASVIWYSSGPEGMRSERIWQTIH